MENEYKPLRINGYWSWYSLKHHSYKGDKENLPHEIFEKLDGYVSQTKYNKRYETLELAIKALEKAMNKDDKPSLPKVKYTYIRGENVSEEIFDLMVNTSNSKELSFETEEAALKAFADAKNKLKPKIEVGDWVKVEVGARNIEKSEGEWFKVVNPNYPHENKIQVSTNFETYRSHWYLKESDVLEVSKKIPFIDGSYVKIPSGFVNRYSIPEREGEWFKVRKSGLAYYGKSLITSNNDWTLRSHNGNGVEILEISFKEPDLLKLPITHDWLVSVKGWQKCNNSRFVKKGLTSNGSLYFRNDDKTGYGSDNNFSELPEKFQMKVRGDYDRVLKLFE